MTTASWPTTRRIAFVEPLQQTDPADGVAFRAVWGQFAVEYKQPILVVCRRWGLGHSDATLVYAELLSDMPELLKKYQPARGRFRCWFASVVRNRAVSRLREIRRITETEEQFARNQPEQLGDSDDPHRIAEAVEQLEWVIREIGLTPQEVQIFELFHLAGYDAKEIKDELNLPNIRIVYKTTEKVYAWGRSHNQLHDADSPR